MGKIKFEKIEKLKSLNRASSFNMYDYIYHEMGIKNIDSDILFAFMEIYWPTFYVFNDYVFLKEGLSENRIAELENQGENVEFWINLVNVDPYFQNDDDCDKKSEALARTLVYIWSTKLKKDFPELDFVVYYFGEEETGDFGLTFYQKKNEVCVNSSNCENEVPKPNIKENFNVYVSESLKSLGKPKIRPARADEIPG